MKKLFLLMTLVFVTNCTGGKNVLCEAGKATASVVAVGISTELACTNVDAIKTSLQAKLESTSVCEAPKEVTTRGAIGNVVCGPLIEGVFAGGIAQLPKEWGCTGGASVNELKAKLIESCLKAI